jgi:hypothetical protein
MKLFQSEKFVNRPENIYFEKGYLEEYLLGSEKHLVQCQGVEEVCEFKKELDLWILQGLHDAGVLLVLGTDSGTGGMGIIPGYSVHDELRILVENGFSPYEALATSTVNAAEVAERMGVQSKFGTIEAGKRADLVLVADNPLEDIRVLRSPLGLMTAGRWYPADELEKLSELSSPVP